MTVGLGSVAVPGALAALDLAQRQFGRLPWRDVVWPAQEVARTGFPLGSAAGYYLPYVRDSAFAWDPATVQALQRADGGWVDTGDLMQIAGLGDTVRLIAEEGARTLYDGELASRVVADMSDRGGLVTADDLAAYQPLLRPALPVRTGSWELRTNPPPSIGGPVLAAMLTLLGERPAGVDAEDVAHLVAVQRRVLDHRRERLDVADDRTAAAYDLLREVGWAGAGSPSTAHVSVVDASGTACAITSSYGYGSGATVPGTGLWLNNCLGERELNRAAPAAPGTRLASNMAPTVGRRDDGAVLAVGSPGADRITTALLQVLASVAHGATSLQAAVDQPRLHVHHLEDDEGPRTATARGCRSRPRRTCRCRTSTCRCAGTTRCRCTSAEWGQRCDCRRVGSRRRRTRDGRVPRWSRPTASGAAGYGRAAASRIRATSARPASMSPPCAARAKSNDEVADRLWPEPCVGRGCGGAGQRTSSLWPALRSGSRPVAR